MSGVLNALAQFSEVADARRASVDTDGARPTPSVLTKTLREIEEIAGRDVRPFQLSDLPAYIDAVKGLNSGLDDRLLLLEKMLVLMSRLPNDSSFSKELEGLLIDLLYKDLPHPPSGYIATYPSVTAVASEAASAKSVPYAFRTTDGSNYNPLFPSLGKAGTPYARSVPSTNISPNASLPDPGLIFDLLLRRDEAKGFVPHPTGISSLFFAFADLVIHSIFDTRHRDWTINDTSSYLDLSPLYGSSEAAVNSVRRIDGSGKLWNDVFADNRLRHMPPSTCALLVLLSRNHNYIASKIFEINEKRNFRPLPIADPALLRPQDDEIFHRARLVNSGFFMQIVLGDYVGAILGLARDGLSWRLNPRERMRRIGHEFCPQGEGNAVSVEFNLLYRWHATLSAQDTKWTEDFFHKIFEGQKFKDITVDDFQHAARKHLVPDPDVKQWTFNGLLRDKEGRFSNDALAEILQNATEWTAGAFGARGTPEVLRVIEIMSILQARSWGTCSLNEFRKFIGLKPYSSFKEWNPDEKIHEAAEALYRDIDNLELHVGLQAEEAKKPMPGAGLCPGYTISRAILADAVCLTRGDRFLTVEHTPYNYTTWGYQDCQYNPDDGSFGGMLTKLLFRHLPDHYPVGSAYAHFPFQVPGIMKTHAAKLRSNPVDKYSWSRPLKRKPVVVVRKHDEVQQVFGDNATFPSPHEDRLFNLTSGAVLDHDLVKHVMYSDNNLKKWSSSFSTLTQRLLKEKEIKQAGSAVRYVDVVKDVINLVPVHWIANEVAGLPIKTHDNPRGMYREQELYQNFADISNYVLLNYDPVDDWTLHEKAQKAAEIIINYIRAHLVKLSKGALSVDTFSESVIRWVKGNSDRSDTLLRQLLDTGTSNFPWELAASLFAEIIPTTAHWSKAISHIVNFFLNEERKDALAAIIRLCGQSENEAKLLSYAYEALRLDPIEVGVHRTVTASVQLSGQRIEPGDRIFADVSQSNLDTSAWGPNPQIAAYERDPSNIARWGFGEHGLLSQKMFEKTAPPVLRAIFGLPNLHRGPGDSGKLNRFKHCIHNFSIESYVNSRGEISPWPDSLVVQFTAKE